MSKAKLPHTNKKLLTALVLGATVLCSPSNSLATPDQGKWQDDNAKVAQIVKNGDITNITSSNLNNVLNWQTFDVGEKEIVRFDNGDFKNNYLNLIHDRGTSLIFGKIEGGKNVYLINPNGFLFGVDSQVNVGNLYVSTRPLDSVDDNYFTISGIMKPLMDKNKLKGDIIDFGVTRADSVKFEGGWIILFSRDDLITSRRPELIAKWDLMVVDEWIPKNMVTSKGQERYLTYALELYEATKQGVMSKLKHFWVELNAQKENTSKRKEALTQVLSKTSNKEQDARLMLQLIEKQDQERMKLLQGYEQQLEALHEKYENEQQELSNFSKEKLRDFIRQEQNELSKRKFKGSMVDFFKKDLKNLVKASSKHLKKFSNSVEDEGLLMMKRNVILNKERRAIDDLTNKMVKERADLINRQKAEISQFLETSNLDKATKEALIETAKR